jgi:hypothetical protein
MLRVWCCQSHGDAALMAETHQRLDYIDQHNEAPISVQKYQLDLQTPKVKSMTQYSPCICSVIFPSQLTPVAHCMSWEHPTTRYVSSWQKTVAENMLSRKLSVSGHKLCSILDLYFNKESHYGNLRFSQWWLWRMSSSRLRRCVDLALTDVSEERISSIFRV